MYYVGTKVETKNRDMIANIFSCIRRSKGFSKVCLGGTPNDNLYVWAIQLCNDKLLAGV